MNTYHLIQALGKHTKEAARKAIADQVADSLWIPDLHDQVDPPADALHEEIEDSKKYNYPFKAVHHVNIRAKPTNFGISKPGYAITGSHKAIVAQADIRIAYSDGSGTIYYSVHAHYVHLRHIDVQPCCDRPATDPRRWSWTWSRQYQAFFDPTRDYSLPWSEEEMLQYFNRSYERNTDHLQIHLCDPGFMDQLSALTNKVVMMLNQHVSTVSSQATRIRKKMVDEMIPLDNCPTCGYGRCSEFDRSDFKKRAMTAERWRRAWTNTTSPFGG